MKISISSLAILVIGLLLYWEYNSSDTDHFIHGAEYMAERLRNATSPEEQLSAAIELNQRFHGYSVRAFGKSGERIVENRDIHSVEIEFSNSKRTQVRFDVLNQEILIHVYGE
jgi:hypothetical protein